ncbi:MAG: response regulator [Desulfomonilaceae bacterium]
MKKILIVDDLQEVRQLLTTTLSRTKYQILTAENGLLAVEAARKQQPDLIIMDVMMPGPISGLEATRILKGDPQTKLCPIIILTGKDLTEDLRTTPQPGADKYITKPFSPLKLIDEVESFLGGIGEPLG